MVAELLKEAKVSTDKKDLRYHEEHILLIRLGNLMTSGRLTYTKYVDMKTKHHNKMRQKLLDNEIEYYRYYALLIYKEQNEWLQVYQSLKLVFFDNVALNLK